MAYSEAYAERVRLALVETNNICEQTMFGSLGFMVNAHLAVGVGDGCDGSILMMRVGKENAAGFLHEPGSMMGKRKMHGWIDLTPEAIESDEFLQRWVARGVDFANTLPSKEE